MDNTNSTFWQRHSLLILPWSYDDGEWTRSRPSTEDKGPFPVAQSKWVVPSYKRLIQILSWNTQINLLKTFIQDIRKSDILTKIKNGRLIASGLSNHLNFSVFCYIMFKKSPQSSNPLIHDKYQTFCCKSKKFPLTTLGQIQLENFCNHWTHLFWLKYHWDPCGHPNKFEIMLSMLKNN